MSFEPLEDRRLLAAIASIDPTDGVRLSIETEQAAVVVGDWATAGAFEGWTATNAAASSGDGSLRVVASSATSTVMVQREGIAAGPSLDYGYFNYLQFRLQLPAGYATELTVSFGTSTNTGFAAGREFTVPTSDAAADGAFHVYRVDLGTQVWWKDTLTDLRLTIPALAAGQAATLDYVEVGDLPYDMVTTYTVGLNMAPGVTAATRQSVTSKHFVFWYDPAVNPGGRTNWATMAKNALHMSENALQVYTTLNGYADPTRYVNDGARHKINLTTWYSGYWASGSYFNVDTSGLQDEGPGNPVPHELGHVVDAQQATPLAGEHWESHADFHRSNWVGNYAAYFPSNVGYDMATKTLEMSNVRQDYPFLIYDDSRIFQAATEAGIEAALWNQGTSWATVYDQLAQVLPAGTNLKDWLGEFMSRWPMLDFSNRDLMRAHFWNTPNAKAYLDWATETPLDAGPDLGDGWYRVPMERAPEKFAYSFHNITPTSTSLTVTFRGFTTIDPTADWRWGLQEVDAENNVRYSPIWGPGTQSWTLNSASSRVILFVIATPGDTSLTPAANYNLQPVQKDVARLQYPYEVQLTGAVPTSGAAAQLHYALGSGHLHPNGGGWVDNTATVAATAYVGPNARVLGFATVSGTARITDYAVVADRATISDAAVVGGYAAVINNGRVSGNARLRDHALVSWNGVVSGSAVAAEYTHLENVTITGDAIARGVSHPLGGTISGTAIVDGDYAFYYDLSDGVHYGHWAWGAGEYADYETRQTKPRGLIASYRTMEPGGDLWWDEFGSAQAILRGGPTRTADDFFQGSPVLEFDGMNDYVTLDRQLADLTTASYSLWFNPATATVDQPLLFFGSDVANAFQVVARDADGRAVVSITVGGVTTTIRSSSMIPVGEWTHLGITFGSGTMTLFIDGAADGTIATSVTPSQVLGVAGVGAAEAAYVGRDASGVLFAGRIEDLGVSNVTLTADEMADAMARSGGILGRFSRTTPTTFDGVSTTATSGVHAGLVRTISSWINPASAAAAGSSYRAIADATDITGARTGSGLGVGGGMFLVRLDNTGMWNTGVPVVIGQWQQVTLTFDGSVANLYVNGSLRATRAYAATAATIPGESYRIGYGQTGRDPATRVMFDGQIQDLWIADRVIPPVPLEALAAYRADEASGSALADATGNGRNAALTGSFSFGAGHAGNAVILTGGHATLPTGVVSTLDDFTIATWVKLSSLDTWARIFDFGSSTANYMFLTARASTGRPRFAIRTPGTGEQILDSSVTIPTGVWTHVAVTLAGSTARLYINGIQRGIATGVNLTPSDLGLTAANFIGKSQFSDPMLAGGIDDFRLYGRGLSSAEIATLVSASQGPSVATAAAAAVVDNRTATLTVLGAATGGESSLAYTWSVAGVPPAPVLFGDNGTNTAKETTALFTAEGTYTLRATVTDAAGQTATSEVTVTVTASLSTIVPPSTDLIAGTSRQFIAIDQFGQPLPAGAVVWTTSSGLITSTGLLTAPATGLVTVTATMGSVSAQATAHVVSPIAWYTGDSIAGGSLRDSSGNQFHGTLVGTQGGTYAAAAGVIQNSLRLNPTSMNNGYATLPATITSGLTDFTISVWVNPASIATWARVLDFGTGTDRYMFLTPADGDGRLRFAITTSSNGGEQSVASATGLPTGTWSLLTVTLSGTTATLYVNGTPVGVNPGMTLTPASLGATKLYLGKSQWPDPNLNGRIDDLRIYDTPLTADDIASLYAAGLASASAAPTNLITTAIGPQQVDLSWADHAPLAAFYLVERATNAAFTAGLTTITLPAGSTGHSDTSVAAGTTYFYRVTAILPGTTPAGPVTAAAITTPPPVVDRVYSPPAGGSVAASTSETGPGQIIMRGEGTLILGLPNSHSGGTVVEAGELVIRDLEALGSGPLEIRDGGRVRFDAGAGRVVMPGLAISASGTLDVGGGAFVMAAGTYDLTILRNLIDAGRAGGTWTGPGIVSGLAQTEPFRAVGYQRAADGSLVVGYAGVGDANLDGSVTVSDLIMINGGQKYGQNTTDAGWWEGDFNGDGRFNVNDLIMLAASSLYGSGGYRPAGQSPSGMTSSGVAGSFPVATAAASVVAEASPVADGDESGASEAQAFWIAFGVNQTTPDARPTPKWRLFAQNPG